MIHVDGPFHAVLFLRPLHWRRAGLPHVMACAADLLTQLVQLALQLADLVA